MSFLCDTVTSLAVRGMVSGVVPAGLGGGKRKSYPRNGCGLPDPQRMGKQKSSGTFRTAIFQSEQGKIQIACGGGIFLGKSEKALKTQIKGIKTKTENHGNQKPPWWAVENQKIRRYFTSKRRVVLVLVYCAATSGSAFFRAVVSRRLEVTVL